MLRTCTFLVLALLASAAWAQEPQDALVPLAALVGQWEGTAVATTPQGRVELIQTEDVRLELGGALIVVEGTGREVGPGGEPGEVVFNAHGVFSVDGATGEVWLDAFTMENRHTRVQPTITEDGFEWELRPENGPIIHYTMRFDEDGRWVETGKVSMDGGSSWIDFFEMTLARVDAE